MKILILVHSLTGGGAERVAALWATGLMERGHQVGMVLSCGKSTPITYIIPENVKIHHIFDNPVKRWIISRLYSKMGIDTYYVRKLKSIICSFQPDAIIGVMQPWTEWSRKATKGMNFHIINTEHNSFERPAYAPMHKSQWTRKYEWNKRYDHVTVLTSADKLLVEGILSNVSVLPNPLAYTPVSKFPNKEKIILAAGRLDAWHYKGFDLLIKAWGTIAKDYPEWKLQIAGDSKRKGKEFLQALANEACLDKQVEFIGYQNDMLPIYQRASIFVMSSRYEGFGMVLIEAMSQGCAPIACDYKGRQREIITSDQEGLLCPTDNVTALVEAIKKLIGNDLYRDRMQKEAIVRSQNYSLDKIIDRWEFILNKLK